MKIYDLSGQEQEAAWLEEHYGTVFTQGKSDKHRVVALCEGEGDPTLIVTVLGESVRVECFFFGYPAGMLAWQTDAEGIATFPLPLNFPYKLTGQGTHWVNVNELRIMGLGVPERAWNWRHLDVVFEEI